MDNMPRVLILYIVHNSGHHAAARYLEAAFGRQTPAVETRCIDLLKYTHPRWERIVQRMYMSTIRRTPELWEALYDNFWIEHLTRRLRPLVRQGRGEALRRLMAEFEPDAVVCTQAYPLAVLADYAERHHPGLPLVGVTTDFVPHRFWINSNSSHAWYVVPTESAAARLMWLGIDRDRIRVLGIPVSTGLAATSAPAHRSAADRRVLVMGGGRGIGVCYRTVWRLDRSAAPFTLDVVCGMNRRLRRRLIRARRRFRHPIRVRGYVHNAVFLMTRAELMVSKAGGMTLAEAACVGVPLLLVHPLPGQERGNTDVMVHHGAALHVRTEYDVTRSVTALLDNPELLRMMRQKALALGTPDAADQVARLVLDILSPGTSG
jgi:processive 1,2-diacylglycerol beta-glucosyltransferase